MSSVVGGCKSLGLTLLALLFAPGFSRGFFERVIDAAELCRFGFGGRSLRMGNAEVGDFSLLFESVDFLLAFDREVDTGLSMVGVADDRDVLAEQMIVSCTICYLQSSRC